MKNNEWWQDLWEFERLGLVAGTVALLFATSVLVVAAAVVLVIGVL